MKKKLIAGLGVYQGVLEVALVTLLSLVSLPASAATSAEATTPEFRLSIKHDGIRASSGEETLRYSPLWDGGSNETAKVTLKQGDAVLSEDLTAEGDYAWSVSANGTYNLTHTTYTNGAVAKVLNATFVVTGKDQPFPPGSVTVTGWNGKYDGNGHGITVTTTDIANPSITYSRTEAGPYTETNPLFTNVCNETVWYVVAAPGYITETNSAAVVIENGDIGGGGGEEPGPGEIPEGGLSKYDATYVYDGEGHTINTQALFAVTLPGAVPSFSFAKDDGGQGLPALPDAPTWVEDAPAYTNVGKYVVWYRITAPNYSNFVHAACVTITNKPVRVMSAEAHQRYPWNGLVDIDVTFDGEPGDLTQVECTFAATNSATKTELPITYISRAGSDVGSGRAWMRRYVWNAAADLGEVEITNVVLTVSAKSLGAVRLWENGPYWAECNVGATQPEDYGYYFWWGDTVGYKRNANNDGWVSVRDGTAFSFLAENCQTLNKDKSELQSEGYVDATGNLVATHDAATAHLGTQWRMPTDAEFSALINNCDTQWTTRGGVYGRLVTGRGSYASKSIFLPAACDGCDYDDLRDPGLYGVYWTSAPSSHDSYLATHLLFDSSCLKTGVFFRFCGQSVRPVREIAPVTVLDGASLEFRLSIKHYGVRISSGDETLRYSPLWDGGSNETAKVTLKQGDAVLSENLTAEGDYAWSVTRNGTYNLTHTTYTNGAVAKVLNATFVVTGKDIPFPPGSVTATGYNGKYDGNGHGITVTTTDIANPLITYARTEAGPYTETNPLFTNVCDETVWYVVAAPGYVTETNSATVVITSGDIGGGGGDEPGSGEIPEGGLSKFDATYVYDGEGHTIKTQALFAVTLPGAAPSFSFAKDDGGVGHTALPSDVTWTAVAPAYTNAGTYVVWYRITAPNYSNFVHAAKITISPCPVTLTSGTKTDFVYNGQPHELPVLIKSESWFAAGEGITTSNWATVTTVAEGEVPNTFDYAPIEGTKLSNYDISVVTGKIAVVKGTIPGGGEEPGPGEIPEGGKSKFDVSRAYDGDGHTIDTNALTAAFAGNMVGEFEIAYVAGRGATGAPGEAPVEGWSTEIPAFTNVVATSLWYKVTSPNYEDFVHEAKVTITNRPIAIASVAAIADQTYAGSAIKPVPTVTDQRMLIGATSPTDIITTDDYAVSYADNIDVGMAKVILTGANNYAGVVTNTFQIVPAIIPPGPGGAITATGYTNVYDGAAHRVSVTATGLLTTPTIQYKSRETEEWQNDSPDYVHVCDTKVWWKVSAPNYQPVEGTIGVKIAPRPVTLTSGTKTDFVYNGQPHELPVLIKSENWFVTGEGITTSNWASVMTVTEGEVPNTFNYAPIEGTKLSNYDISVVTGVIAVVKGSVPPGDDPEKPDPTKPLPPGALSKFDGVAMYDGAGHTLKTNELAAAFGAVLVGEFEVQYARGDVGRGATDAPEVGAWSTVAPVFTNACEEIVWYKVTNPNYEDYVHAAKVTVTNRPITVTSASGEWVYDTVAHGTNGVTIAMTGGAAGVRALPGNDSIEVSDFPSITDVGSKANAFSWAFGAGTLATNYCVSCVTGTLTVTARPIGDDPANWDIRLGEALKYSGEEQSAPLIQVAYRKPDGNLVDIPYTLVDDKATDAGNYKVKISGSGNYAGTVAKDWAIVERNVMFTSMTTNWVYDGVAHTADVVTVTGDGFVEGEGVTFAGFPGVRHVSDASTPIENSFTYSWNEGTKAKNYSVKTSFGTVQMAKRTISLTSPTWDKTYDGGPLTFEAKDIVAVLTGEGGAAGVRALPEGENFSYGNFASITEAGQIPASFTVADGTALVADYTITSVFGKLTVTKNATEITVTAKSTSWVYDGAEHKLNEYDAPNAASVLLPGDALEVTFDDASVITTPIDGPNKDGKVENKITNVRVIRNSTEIVTKNYTLAWYPGELKVTKRPVTLTSKSADKVYDGTPLVAHEVSVGGDEFVGEDGATYSFTGSQTDKGSSDNEFSYALKTGTNAAYYDIATAFGTLTVKAADITLGGEGDLVVTLGPSLTYNGLAQLQTVASVTYKGLPVDFSATDNQQTDAGAYKLTLTGLGNFAGTTNVAWTLNKKALTLTAGSGSKVYDGAPLTVSTVTAEGFVSGEGATYVCAGAQLDVGDSANAVSEINWNANTKGSNYSVTKKPGKLTVTPRAVTVTSKNISKPYDGSPLTLTAADIEVTQTPSQVTLGRANTPGSPQSRQNAISLGGDCISTGEAAAKRSLEWCAAGVRALPLGATNGALPSGESFVYGDFAERSEAGQTPATFSIAAGPNTKLTNYTITPVYGTITITKSATEISVTANSESWVYDGEAHSNRTYTATNLGTLQSGDELAVTFDSASVVQTPQDGLGGDGKVANTITSVRVIRTTGSKQQDVTDNYTIGIYPGTLTVTKRPVTVKVEGKTKTVTYDGEEHTVTGYDISTEDELYDIDADTTFSGTGEVKGTDAATYDMGLKAEDFANKNDCFDVTYDVTDGKLTIAKADISGDACVITLGANPKYNGTVQTIEVKSVALRDGEGAVATQLPVTYDLTGQNATDAGVYTLTVKGTGNFKGEKSTTWSILKRAVTLTSGSASRAYNGQPLVKNEVSVTGDGFVGNEGATYTVTGSQTVAGSSANAFTYALKAGTKADNYTITPIEGTLTVTKATYPGQEPGGAGITWNVSPDAATWMYDGAEHGIAVTGVPVGVTPVYTGHVATDAGTYTASVTLLFDAENYEAPVAPAPITWSITQRPITLMAASKDKPYDGFPLEVEPGDITASGSGYATGECFDYYERASITDVGETAATFKYRDSATAKVANYVVTVKGGQTLKVTVGGDQISVTADSATWAYDGEEHAKPSWTFVNAAKLLAGHEFKIKIAESSKILTPKDGLEHNGIVSNAFEYVKVIETATGKDRTKNYNLFVYEGVLQITNRVICSEELRVNREEFKSKVDKIYDGVATQVVVSAELLQPETVRYWCDDGAAGVRALPEWVVFRSEPYAFTHATNAVVWFTVSADYYHTYTGKVEVAIAKRPVTVKTPTRSKTYDGGALTFGAGDVEVALTGGAAGVRALPEGESFVYDDFASIMDAGKIDATCSIAAGVKTSLDDYDITTNWGTLTVLASADQITVTAKNGEWTYDGQPHELHEYVAENETKLLAGDTLAVSFSTDSVVTTPQDGVAQDGIVSNVITSVKVMRGDVDVSKNYSLAWYGGTLRVVNANVPSEKVKVTSDEVVYDGDGHSISVAVEELLTSPVTVRYGLTSDTVTATVPPDFTDAGTHTVFYQVSAKYYNTYSGSATVTIKPRPVTLVSGGATRVYNGQPLRKNEVTVKEGSLDFVKDEGFSATCSGSITGVGGMENLFDYELTGGAKSGNYTIKKEYGWLRVTPATLDPSEVIGVDPVAYEWVYDAEAHPFVVTPKMSESYKMYYSLTANDESTYSEKILTFTKATKTPTPVYFKLMSANFMPLYGTGTVHITKCPVTPPEIASKVYNGNVQTADVQMVVLHGKFAYYILGNAGRKEAGEGAVILMLNDSKNYAWTTTDKSFVTLPFFITKAENAWKVQPSISGWSIKDTPSVPVAEANFGTVSVTYNGTTKSGKKIENALAVTEPGIYTAVFVVPAETSWTGLRSEVVFTVSDGGETPLTVKALGYLGVYDGKPHTISVTVKGGDGNFELTYSESETGPWQKNPPMYVEPCSKTVWYRVTSPNYATMTGRATVTISEAKQEEVVINPGGGAAPIKIPSSWFQQYPKLGGSSVQDWQVIAQQPSGKTDAKGNTLYVWQDYVCGTDPTDLTSRFTATIDFSDGIPVVTWWPALNGEGVKTGVRTYTTRGKVNLKDKDWQLVPQGWEKNYHFFTVTVEMPEER